MQKIILTTAIAFLFLNAAAQNKDELQKQRQQLKKEIEETEKVLNQTKKTTKENMGQLSLINKRLDLQGNVIQNITGQLKFIDNDIYKSQREVNKLAKVLDTLKQEYAKSMVYAYKNRNSYDFLNFIFSASGFNDAVKRITYLKSYRTYREQQGENIVRTQELLHSRINELSGNKQKKNVVLQEKNKEMTVLEKQQDEKQKIVEKLKGRQKELTAQINNKRKQDAKLRNMIAVMIKKEVDRIRRENEERERLARTKPKPSNSTDVAITKPSVRVPKKTESVLVSSEADRVLDANFERNRGSLPWPADGFVLSHYGRNVLTDRVEYNNPGVNIGTSVGASVKAIFDGEVTLVNSMDDKQVVFIKHGKYFTVYSNLSSANVQRGQTVKTGQAIGRAGANDDGQGEIDLIIMKENNNVNPEQWLRRK
ncbi:MAG TPA: peptidoglycan DD-metalloendopeptidase family protein [Chitinophagaceae bacterium]|nr:peptidoglycan DD-metalloendopeptidase family protein [Chitinophagaceae bacterium]